MCNNREFLTLNDLGGKPTLVMFLLTVSVNACLGSNIK